MLFAVEASKRWAADGITANAITPGGIRTALQRHQQGEAMTPEIRTIFENRGEALPHNPQSTDSTEPSGVAAHALDEQDAARLWEVSLAMLGA
ncbi:hypothetical protein [Streptomyces sp. NPDC059743]|uniref:hypothetical protein n=1 Tax=Streptomyces sp. NPDC059743 TaxID=3346928 RepID=UPI003661AFB1